MGRVYTIFITLFLGAVLVSQLVLPFVFQFPLFHADNQVGYWPQPNQSGAMLGNEWAFNSDSMGVAEEYKPSARFDLMVVGDSIVDGGKQVAQANKLGPMLEAQTGWQVWPVSAGSWALQNELAFLHRKEAEVRQADAIVFVFNSEDFAEPSSWSSEFTHPRRFPWFFGGYLIGKFWLGDPNPPVPPELKVKRSADLAGDWRRFVESQTVPVVAIGVPKRSERDCSWMPEWIGSRTCVRLRGDDYEDDIHPSKAGRERINAAIVEAL